jgi:arsenate reductase
LLWAGGEGGGCRRAVLRMTERVQTVLFLCTGNSARSVMAEALLNVRSKGRFRAYSAGSHPAGKVNPFAVELVEKIGYPTAELRSKSWDEFAASGAPAIDFVITVCDNAAGEVCPIWPGKPTKAHWSFEDPAAVQGTDDEKRKAFHDIYLQIARRIDLFLALPHP